MAYSPKSPGRRNMDRMNERKEELAIKLTQALTEEFNTSSLSIARGIGFRNGLCIEFRVQNLDDLDSTPSQEVLEMARGSLLGPY